MSPGCGWTTSAISRRQWAKSCGSRAGALQLDQAIGELTGVAGIRWIVLRHGGTAGADRIHETFHDPSFAHSSHERVDDPSPVGFAELLVYSLVRDDLHVALRER